MADCVVTNPPFFEPGTVRVSPDKGRARAHVLPPAQAGPTLAAWLRASLALLKPGGRFVMIHRPDALATILAAVENRLGAVALLPVHPFAGAPAHRVLIAGIKGSKAPLGIAPALILHQSGRRAHRRGRRDPPRRGAHRLGRAGASGLVTSGGVIG